MLRIFKCSAMAGSFIAMLALAGAPDASAQFDMKKLTYEEAWAVCKKDVVANYPNEYGVTAGRYARMGACMYDYGYKP
jgi:hypothetical protein